MSSSSEGATILVTGAGGPAGVAVIQDLQRHGHVVVGADADAAAVGLRLADHGAVLPRADDPGFVMGVCDLGERYDCSVLISTVAEELATLAEHREVLEGAGLRTWLPDAKAVETCVDKWQFSEICSRAGLPVPATSIGDPTQVPGPWICKPRFGRGSRDVYTAETVEELMELLPRVPDPLVQTRLSGSEFTADGLIAPDGKLVGCVPRWRLETKAGISTKGETFLSPGIDALVEATAAAVGLTGPICLQGFLDGDRLGLIEVNPRFSGGLPLSLAAGCDLVGQYVEVICGGQIDPSKLTTRAGVVMLRYFAEVFEH